MRPEKIISKYTRYLLLSAVFLFTRAVYGEIFSFAVLADPHISGNPAHRSKFEAAVDWIIDNKETKDIELVFVLGDIAWGGSRSNRNLTAARKILDRLNENEITYIPIIGDNEVHAGSEKEFQQIFESHFKILSAILNNWQKASVPVKNIYLQNFSFDYKGCHFLCPDFISRKAGGEGGELHDFTGGTWAWFKNDIERCPKPKNENIIIMTHIGMFHIGFEFADKYVFSAVEMDKIKGFLGDYKDNIDSNYAGHLHLNWYVPVWSGLFLPIYHVRITDETWSALQWPETKEPGLTVRWVQVDSSGTKISYRQNIEIIKDEPAQH